MGTLRGPSSAAAFGQQTWAGVWTHRWAEVPHADALGTGAAASVCKEFARDVSLQTPCRTMYCGRTLPNALFITFFFYI